MGINRCDLMVKAFKVIDLFNSKRNVTSQDVAEYLEIHRKNAELWLRAASLVLPIYNPNELDRGPHDFMIYRWLKE